MCITPLSSFQLKTKQKIKKKIQENGVSLLRSIFQCDVVERRASPAGPGRRQKSL
jgi:hypothetical protein